MATVYDLLSPNSYLSFNVNLAQKVGLNAAVYLAELLNQSKIATASGKLTDNLYFKVSRSEVEHNTTLSRKEQATLDETLSNVGVIKISLESNNLLHIDTDLLTSIILEDNELTKKKLEPVIKKRKVSTLSPEAKANAQIANARRAVTTSNEELQEAYYKWIDNLQVKQGWITASIVEEAQRVIDDFTQRDLDMALAIIHIATANVYKDMTWAINKYKADNMRSSRNVIEREAQNPQPKQRIEFTDEEY